MQSLSIIITGKVYRAGYLYFIKQRANKLHITGTAKYSGPDTVNILARGSRYNMDKFIQYCRLGTSLSEVEEFLTFETTLEASSSFEIFEDK